MRIGHGLVLGPERHDQRRHVDVVVGGGDDDAIATGNGGDTNTRQRETIAGVRMREIEPHGGVAFGAFEVARLVIVVVVVVVVGQWKGCRWRRRCCYPGGSRGGRPRGRRSRRRRWRRDFQIAQGGDTEIGRRIVDRRG